MPCKNTLEYRENIMTLLPHRREVTADATKCRCPVRCPKAARNFLLHFHHAQISFCQVVVKGYPKVVHKGQGLTPIEAQAIEQILGFALAFATPLTRWRLRQGRIQSQPFPHNRAIALLELGYRLAF